jgi:hypothetical protein
MSYIVARGGERASKNTGPRENGESDTWLSGVDAFRTFAAAPPVEIRAWFSCIFNYLWLHEALVTHDTTLCPSKT